MPFCLFCYSHFAWRLTYWTKLLGSFDLSLLIASRILANYALLEVSWVSHKLGDVLFVYHLRNGLPNHIVQGLCRMQSRNCCIAYCLLVISSKCCRNYQTDYIKLLRIGGNCTLKFILEAHDLLYWPMHKACFWWIFTMNKSRYGVFGNNEWSWNQRWQFYYISCVDGAYRAVIFNVYYLFRVGFWNVILEVEMGIWVIQSAIGLWSCCLVFSFNASNFVYK